LAPSLTPPPSAVEDIRDRDSVSEYAV